MNSHAVPEKSAFKIKSYSPGELAVFYEVDPKTFRNWLKPHVSDIGERAGRFFTSKQVQIIIDKIGFPPEVD